MGLRRTFYPDLAPFDAGMLRVSDLHAIYYEQSGHPQGKPALVLHGGPGSGSDARQRRFFDPHAYRVVMLDQRGSGRSTPHASLVDNTTWHLVDDIERLREHLGIERWLVFGGSWGSTLGLAYAQRHPDRVTELVLRGVCMMRPRELAWIYREGANALFPDAWEAFTAFIPPPERDDLIAAYHRRLTSDDAELRLAAAKAWTAWEATTSFLVPDRARIDRAQADELALAFARIESHYLLHRGFFPREDQLLEDVGKIRDIPGVLVHGRYDVVCPVASAWDLHRAWPEAELVVVGEAGHSAYEPATLEALVRATDRFRR